MGVNISTPNAAMPINEQIFEPEDSIKADFPQHFITKLQRSPDTDQSRSATQELHLQTRVNAELRRLSAEADETLQSLLSNPSHTIDSPQSSSNSISQTLDPDVPSDPSREKIQAEIDALKKRLTRMQTMGKEVEKAEATRGVLVECLRERGMIRENGEEGRMLDCWKEIENFKAEVDKMKAEWLRRKLS